MGEKGFTGVGHQPSGRGARRIAIAALGALGVVTVVSGPAGALAPVSIAKLTPAVLGQGASKAVVVTGSGFAPGAVATVTGGGVAVKKTVFSSDAKLKVTLKVGTSATPGLRSIAVTNADGGVGTCTACLTITAAPRILGISPSAVVPGQAATLTVTGIGFQPRAKVTTTNKTPLKATYVSPTQLDVVATPNLDAPLGARTLTVKNPDLGKSKCKACLTVVPGVSVTAALPGWVSRGVTSTVRLTGTEFAPGATVSVSGSGVTVDSASVVDGEHLEAAITTAADAPAVVRILTVTDPDGRAGVAYLGVADTALIYGDSLTWESTPSLNQQLSSQPTWKARVHSFPATAPCLWRDWVAEDLATYHPKIVVLTTAGNSYNPTYPCMVDPTGQPIEMGSPEYYVKTREDLDVIFSAVTATGAQMVFDVAPPMLDPVREEVVVQTGVIATELAAEYPGVSIAPYVRDALSSDGGYTDTLPCLPGETEAMGCSAGIIPVRTTSGTQAGLHLCPGGLPTYPWFCDTYSSGEVRFAGALLQSILTPPPPVMP